MTAIFVGVHGDVVALDRATGQELWHTKLAGGDFVNLLLDQDRIIATTKGKCSAWMWRRGSYCGVTTCRALAWAS